jgi:hypothetical protein
MQRLKVRKWIVAISIIMLIMGALLTMRQIGVPSPEVMHMQTTRSHFYNLAGRVFGWRTQIKYPNGRIKARGFERGSYMSRTLVRAEYYAPDGNVRSRVVDGSGFGIIFDNNGRPLVLTGFINGMQSGPHFVWNGEGKLVRAEYLDSSGNVENYLPDTGGSISSVSQESKHE